MEEKNKKGQESRKKTNDDVFKCNSSKNYAQWKLKIFIFSQIHSTVGSLLKRTTVLPTCFFERLKSFLNKDRVDIAIFYTVISK